jgi:hypothetical protein
MNIYRVFYTLNDDLKQYVIDFEVVDRKAAIELLLNVGRNLGLNYKIVSCRKLKQGKHHEQTTRLAGRRSPLLCKKSRTA